MKSTELVFFTGKMAAGKSTYAKKLSAEKGAVLISEDEWLASLYPEKIETLQDYVIYSNLLKERIKPLVQSILAAGTDVVLDFPANTVKQRDWFRQIFQPVGASHTLIYLKADDELCLSRIQERRRLDHTRAKTDTEEMFHQVNAHFVEPSIEEEFNVEIMQQHNLED